ncbi:MAG: biopolymer transporter ExbD [bacterium]|nr:biopolymer transporter ExbD [bacterium]
MAVRMNNVRDDEIISNINVTPMVDIILVLLIVFMVTASVIVTPAIKVDLPRAAHAEDNVESSVALVLSREGKLFLNGKESTWPEMEKQVRRQMQGHHDVQAVISADRQVPHGDVIHLIDVVKGLGIEKFALNIERVLDREG